MGKPTYFQTMKENALSKCKRCYETIASQATVCKTCGQEQQPWLYWVKQIGTPIGLAATVISVILSTVAFVRASQKPIPKAELVITNVEKKEADMLAVEFLNYGNAPTRVRSILIASIVNYSLGGYDSYRGGLRASPHQSIGPDEYATVTFDLTGLYSRSPWEGSLHNLNLPTNIRVPFPEETDGSLSFGSTIECNLTVITSGINGQFPSHPTFPQAPQFCTLIEPYAISYFAKSGFGFSQK